MKTYTGLAIPPPRADIKRYFDRHPRPCGSRPSVSATSCARFASDNHPSRPSPILSWHSP
jgi:hypothetical protein